MAKYVIIGSGAAGIAAIEAIRKHEPSADILQISEDPHWYYSRPGLAFLLTGEIPESQLFPFSDQDFNRLGLRRLKARAVRIHPQSHQIELQNGASVPYQRLLISTGATAQRSNVPGIDLEGVLKLDSLEDARQIVKQSKRGRTAVVVGGGITALEFVEGMHARGVNVHYFLRGDRYWSNVLDEHESRIVEHRLTEEGVHIHFHTDLGEILGKNGRVVGVKTADNKIIKCDLVAVAIGIRPRLELAKASELKIDRGILVDEYLRTSEPDIFAAGDVAQVYDPATKKSLLDSLWTPAREQGYAAGINMTGRSQSYIKVIPFNVTRLAGLTTTIIGTVGKGEDADMSGIARGDSETWRQLPDSIAAQSDFDVNHMRILLGENTLLGALLLGDQTLSRPLQHLVLNRVDILPIRDQLLSSGAALGDIIACFYTDLVQLSNRVATP